MLIYYDPDTDDTTAGISGTGWPASPRCGGISIARPFRKACRVPAVSSDMHMQGASNVYKMVRDILLTK